MKDIKLLKMMLVAVFVIGVAFTSYNAYQYQTLKNRVIGFSDEIKTVTNEDDAKVVIQGFLMGTELDSVGMSASAGSPTQRLCPTDYPECLQHWQVIVKGDKYCSTFPIDDQKKCRNEYQHPYTTALNYAITYHSSVNTFIKNCGTSGTNCTVRKRDYQKANARLSEFTCPIGYGACTSEVEFIKKAMQIKALTSHEMESYVIKVGNLTVLYRKLEKINRSMPNLNTQTNNNSGSQNRNINPEDGSIEGVGANRNNAGSNTGNTNTASGGSNTNTSGNTNTNTNTNQGNTSTNNSSISTTPPVRPWLSTSLHKSGIEDQITSGIDSKEGN